MTTFMEHFTIFKFSDKLIMNCVTKINHLQHIFTSVFSFFISGKKKSSKKIIWSYIVVRYLYMYSR